MKIQKDLYQIEKSKWRVAVGVLLLVSALVFILFKTTDNEKIRAVDWILPIAFVLSGFLNIMEGLGQSPSKLFGSAFLLIDEEHVAFKKGVFSKEKKLAWNEIQSIVYKSNSFLFVTADQESLILRITDLDYILVRQIKEAVQVLAAEKGIMVRREPKVKKHYSHIIKR